MSFAVLWLLVPLAGFAVLFGSLFYIIASEWNKSLEARRKAREPQVIQGPNVKQLIVHKMSLDAVPAKSRNGLADGIAFLTNKNRLVDSARAATDWVELAIEAIRQAREPNPWRNADDETIAGMILAEVEKKKWDQSAKPSVS